MNTDRQTRSRLTTIFAIALAAVASCGTAHAQTTAATTPQRFLIVSIPDRKLVLMQDGTVKRVYPVAVGKASTPSPAGHFTIARRVSNPTYSHHGKVVAPGPKNPVGSRWIGLSAKGYGIHGTNEPNSIGMAASHGCIRMARADLEDLYQLVQVGDVVEIHAQRDAAVEMTLGNTLPLLSTPPAPGIVIAHPVLLARNVETPQSGPTQTQSGQ